MDAEKKGTGAMGRGGLALGLEGGIEKTGVYSPGGLENGRSGGRTAETLLRVLPIGLCVAALVVTLHDSMTSDYGTVKYSDFSGFRYLVYANGACAAYSLFSAFYTAMPRPPTMARAWTLFCLDQVLTYVVLTAAAAGAEILYLAYNGDREVTWSEACQSFGGFCVKAKASVGITFGVFLCYIGISLVSSFRLFSSYDAPIPFLNKNSGVAAFPGSG